MSNCWRQVLSFTRPKSWPIAFALDSLRALRPHLLDRLQADELAQLLQQGLQPCTEAGYHWFPVLRGCARLGQATTQTLP